MVNDDPQIAQRDFSQLVEYLENLIFEKWSDIYSFDSKACIETGKIGILWKKTNQPAPLKELFSKEAYEKGQFTWRDIHRCVKDCLPENMLKQSISNANGLLRNANRRHQGEVLRDYKKWCQATENLLRRLFGLECAEEFTKDPVLSSRYQADSIQTLQILVEHKIDYLRNL